MVGSVKFFWIEFGFSFKNTKYVRLTPVGGAIPGLLGKAISKVVLRSKIIGVIELLFDMVFIMPLLTIYLLTAQRGACLFVTMSSRTIYRSVWLASYFRGDVPLVSIVWDMPSYIINFNTRRFSWTNRLDHWFFDKVISNADTVITMGKNMDQALAIRVPHLPRTVHLKGQAVPDLGQCRPRTV